MLGALSSTVLLLIAGMVLFVFLKAWPSFSHNGLAWFGPGGNVDQQLTDIFNSPANNFNYTLHAWPLIYATALITFISVCVGLVFSVLSAMFIVEFAPNGLRRILEPVVRLLAAVPSVIYGLIGILVVVPWIADTFISPGRKDSVAYVIQLDGTSILVAILILTVMITPIMIAIIVDALRAVPKAWTEGAAALGVNRWRALWTVSVRAARPAIVAAAVLATARALGEAIMLSMVSGSVGFAPNPLDGTTFSSSRRAAGGDDRRQRRGPLGEALRADPLRLCRRPPRLQRLPLLRRVVRAPLPTQVPAEPDRGDGMSTRQPATALGYPPVAAPPGRGASHEEPSWGMRDKVGLAAAWAAGILLCLIAASIMGYMLYRGLQYLQLDMLVTHPLAGLDQSKTGGFLDPILGTSCSPSWGSRSRCRSGSRSRSG
jgi:ABC-type phosphate transport system permease subunit